MIISPLVQLTQMGNQEMERELVCNKESQETVEAGKEREVGGKKEPRKSQGNDNKDSLLQETDRQEKLYRRFFVE